MRIRLCGAAGEVTGSGYLVETGSAQVLVDFGMFQGRGASQARNRAVAPVHPRRLDAVVLTHGHLDHCGRLPILARRGLKAPIYATAATADVAGIVLRDAAHLQQEDAARATRRNLRRGRPPVEPLFTAGDVDAVAARFRPLAYGQPQEVAQGVTIRLFEAGHLLGSASVEMRVETGAGTRVIVFSGDLGVRGTALLRDPEPPPRADLVFLESTYGDRDHRPLGATLDELRGILADAWGARERVLVPAFAIGRSQQILYHVGEMFRTRQLERFPIYLDSPMAIEAVELYRKYRMLLDREAQALGGRELHPDLETLRFCRTPEESQRLNNLRDVALILAGSGMCEGGRIVHHLKHNLWRSYVHVVFVGYQAEGTLGERLVRGAKQVRIHGEEVVVKARIHTLGGFSGHAGQSELLEWLAPMASERPRVVLTHGEERPRAALQGAIRQRYGIEAERPGPGAVIEC
ncbi:MAG: MBL fold metallo-hydrolase [Isosphaeraceae bacterium]|nr:MAG: MBL fold metallo-hydrolase [Isosphaeraceae bacterium]